MPDPSPANPSPRWSRFREIPAVVLHPPHLRRTATIAAIVGVLLFAVNQSDTVLHSGVSAATAVKAALDLLIPFCVSNLGILSATRRPPR